LKRKTVKLTLERILQALITSSKNPLTSAAVSSHNKKFETQK